METEAAFSSSANSFILEKVLQEVKEVENRERQEEEEASTDDLKFRPGFVHLLKDRFALLSIKSSINNAEEDGPLKSSTSVYDIGSSNNLGNSRLISRSSEQLDERPTLNKRHSTHSIGSPERHVNRINGTVIPSSSVSSKAYVRLQSKDATDSPSGVPAKSQPTSIHFYSNTSDARTLDKIRSAGSKVIIIESANTNNQNETRKTPTSPLKVSSPSKAPFSLPESEVADKPKADEAWPVPNTVSSTRSIFEQSRNKRAAPPPPITTNEETTGFTSPKTPSSPARVPPSPVIPTQILVHGQPIKVHQTTNQQKSITSENKVKTPSPAPRRPFSQPDFRKTPLSNVAGSPGSPDLSKVESKHVSEQNGSEQSETVVSVSEARRMFDKGTPANKTSPKRSKGLVFPAFTNTTVNSNRTPPPKKFTAPSPPINSKSYSAGPSSPKKQPLYKAASLPSVVPKTVNTPKSPVETSSRPPVNSPAAQSPISRNDSNTWQTWDDIPKPKRRSFVTEARRVDISKEQLSDSRAKNKSFFFTIAEPAQKAQKLEIEDPRDKTVTISVPKSDQKEQLKTGDSHSAPSQSRLAQETFWSSYRDEDGDTSNIDPELFGDYQKLMASVRAGGSTDSASIDRELEELPSTNIDDIMNDIGDIGGLSNAKPKTVGIRVIVKDKKKVRPKLSFAKDSALISTYEYLSERAMIEELGISPDFDMDGSELSIDDPAALFGLDDDEKEEETAKVSKALQNKSPITAGSLASYKSKYGDNDYAWGQESEAASSLSVSRDLLDGDVGTPNSANAEEESKESQMNWSSATTADLLF